MTFELLGTGTSQGVPLIGCPCEVCTSPDPHDKRLRAAAWLTDGNTSLVIDTGPDFRYQMLRASVKKLDAVLFTHGHKDHTAGLDDVRAYNFIQDRPMDIYLTGETEQVIRREFAYVFENASYPGIPQLQLRSFGNQPFRIGTLDIMPIRVWHHRLEVYGFRIGDLTYITDVNRIDPEELEKCRGTKVLVLSALRHEPHISHFTLAEAIEVAREIGAERTYFTHISHQLGLHDGVNATLSEGMELAWDGLRITV